MVGRNVLAALAAFFWTASATAQEAYALAPLPASGEVRPYPRMGDCKESDCLVSSAQVAAIRAALQLYLAEPKASHTPSVLVGMEGEGVSVTVLPERINAPGVAVTYIFDATGTRKMKTIYNR